MIGLGYCSLSIMAQNALLIKGKITDSETGNALPVANITATSLKDSAVTGIATDFDGNFSFSVAKTGSYRIQISYLGYKTYAEIVNVPVQGIQLGTIKLEKDATTLKSVEIEGQMAQAIQMGDTTQFNSGAFKTNPDANAEELITKMPGISTQNGKVQAQGEDVKQILIDGKPFFGNDVNAALKTLPAEIIDKVQVFDQQSEQARFSGVDDGNTLKTINIVTKPDMRDGIFGRVSAGYGYENRYAASGNFNYFNGDKRITVVVQSNNINQQNFSTEDLLGVSAGSSGGGGGRRSGGPGGGGRGSGGNTSDFMVNTRNGITTTQAAGINYTDKWGKKIKVTGSYFFNWANTRSSQNITRNYLLDNDSGQTYRENSENISANMNHRVNFRMEYEIDSFNVLTITPRITLQKNKGSSFFTGETQRVQNLLNNTLTDFSSDLFALDFSNELNYRHRFQKAGRTLSISINTGYNTNLGNSNLNAQNQFFTDVLLSDSLDQLATLYGNGYSLGTRWVYTEPLGKGHSLNFNYSGNFRRSVSDKKTLGFSETDETYNRLDSLLSNNFKSYYHTESGGLGYRFNNKKIMFILNASYQWAQLNNQNFFPGQNSFVKDFHNVLPFAMFRYTFSPQKNFTIRYRASNNIPSVERFQSVLNNSNPLLLSIGNSDLKQDYSHSFFVRYNSTNTAKSRVLFLLFSVTATQNYIANSTQIAENDTTVLSQIFLPQGAQLSRPVNMNGYVNMRALVTYGLPVKKLKSNLNFTVGANFVRTPGMLNNQVNFSNSPSGNVGITLSSNISKKIDFTISSNTTVTYVNNTLRRNLNSSFVNQNSNARFYWDIWKGIVLTGELTHQLYTGLSDGFNQNFFLWNMGLAKKFLKNDAAEVKFTAFDILNQNNSIIRNVTDVYVEDVETVVLNRYFMLSFTYNFRSFKKKQ